MLQMIHLIGTGSIRSEMSPHSRAWQPNSAGHDFPTSRSTQKLQVFSPELLGDDPRDDAWNSKPHLTWWFCQLWLGKVHSKGWVFSECWSWKNCNLIPGWLNWLNWKATFYLGWCSSLQGQFDYLTTSTYPLLILTYTDQHIEIGDESRARIPY